MKALWYTNFDPTLRHKYTVVWVPEVQLQFHWVQPQGAVQMIPAAHPIPPDPFGELMPEGERYLPYPLIQEARRYLRDQERQRAQEETLQLARNRITDAAIRSDGRLQVAASRFLRDRPANEKRRTKK